MHLSVVYLYPFYIILFKLGIYAFRLTKKTDPQQL